MLISCKRDPDPCAGLKPVSADFKFYQKFIGSEVDSIFYIDTVILVPYKNIYNPARIGFIATEENATYRWELEDYPKNNTTKSFFLDFDQPFGSIEVKLTVTKEPNTSCFPNDDGADTVTKTLVVLDGSKFKFAFEGTFTGYLTDSPSDVFDIRIVNFGERPQRTYTGHYGLRVYNLPKGCGRNNFSPAEYTHEITYGTFRSFYIEGKGYANVPCGKDPFIAVGRVYDHNNKISIHIAAYRYDYSTNKNIRTDSQFIGIRKK
ncbi:MAG: hypothetical protein CRN43_03035 [Candidatus Nephrothrix sp. EaCA]|nr:MAG: hypothetical protein CRN43_03035 [Candidatus Nephrothrix sp. EaCA]